MLHYSARRGRIVGLVRCTRNAVWCQSHRGFESLPLRHAPVAIACYNHVMQDSIFTKIIKGEIPCHKVWEDENFLAFLDVNPRTVGHTLLVPKQQTDYLFDLAPKDYAELWQAARKVAVKLKSVLGCARVCVGVYGYAVSYTHLTLPTT